MTADLKGIHHVTAITSDADKNIGFYRDVLGLHLVKLTVNFDDPTSYHIYYGDRYGSPGTIMTFFVWPDSPSGRAGAPQIVSTAFRVGKDSLEAWEHKLKKYESAERMDERLIRLRDPDGMTVELVEAETESGEEISGLHSVTIFEEGYENTADLLTDVLGFEYDRNEGNIFRYRKGENFVDVVCAPNAKRSVIGAGSIHHVAFRTPDDNDQRTWRKELVEDGYNVSPVIDRKYFHSIYFREPGGVLFEIATDGPGFAVDEEADKLGTHLVLPSWLEGQRMQLEQILPEVHL